ncbi:hypothetical protein GCM10023213_07360 [Prosthecobacter algae]|uniref:Uncharacterized protein n=1 Tax=Prosthecobacter algae TaxID=1144682 RepID=A0ABP9NVK6_9BACT
MVKRRTLDDGLTPEEMAFLNDAPEASKIIPEKDSNQDRSNTASRPKKEMITAPEPEVIASTHVHIGMVGLNTRVEPHISAALLRASTDRKIERRSRAAVQDIVNEALTEWLKKAGYINN